MTKYTLALLPLLMASTALANPATDEGAAHLKEVFQTYLGTTEGVVAVAANGEVYDLTVDITPLAKSFGQTGVTATVSPIEMQLTDNGDGTWGVTQDQPFSMITTEAGVGETKQDIARATMQGTFDEKLMAMSTATGSYEGWVSVATQTMPDGSTVSSETRIDTSSMVSNLVAGATGGVDGEVTYTSTGLTVKASIPQGEGMPAMPIGMTAASAEYSGKLTGLRTEGILGMVAFFVAHPDEAAVKGAKDEMKGVITAALPVWDNIIADGKITAVALETPLGPVAVDEIGFTADVNGAVKDGKFREAVSFSGITLPPGLLPEWAAPILPQKAKIDIQASGFDAAAGFAALLEGIDLPEDGMADTSEFDKKVETAFLPTGSFTVALNPGFVAGDGYELTFQGDMLVDVASEIPTGKAVVTLTGADKIAAAIAAAPDDIRAEASMGFGMAQGMAKPDGDKLVWEIDASTPGTVTVNGMPMMGGQ